MRQTNQLATDGGNRLFFCPKNHENGLLKYRLFRINNGAGGSFSNIQAVQQQNKRQEARSKGSEQNNGFAIQKIYEMRKLTY